jgi:hypothetical protein
MSMPDPEGAPPADCELRRTAYHESGHVIVTLALGLSFDYVVAVPDRKLRPDATGGVVREPGTHPRKDGPDGQLQELHEFVAGWIAEDRFECLCATKKTPLEAERNWIRHRMSRDCTSAKVEVEDDDTENALDLAEAIYTQFGFADVETFLRHVERHVEKLLHEQWPQVDKLAQSLIRSHSLTHHEVCELLAVDSSCPERTFPSFAEELLARP